MNQKLEGLIKGMPPEEGAGIFGASVHPEEASLVLIPVEWDATTSYGGGAASAPQAILNASHQLDLEDLTFDKPYLKGISLLDHEEVILKNNKKASEVIALARSGDEKAVKEINEMSSQVNEVVYQTAKKWIAKGKRVALIGGDHSAPFGYIKALSETRKSFSILHIDAHFDLRESYEGFEYSHASIMYNVLKHFSNVESITHIGIRDFCHDEKQFTELDGRCHVFYDRDVFAAKAEGINFNSITSELLETLSDDVYISFDIDGLDPVNSPSTGTPVPGGLNYSEAMYIIEELSLSGKNIIGFDLCEVVKSKDGSEWDENVGARVLYKMCGALLYS